MKKKKRSSLVRLVFILLAFVFVIGGLVSIVKVANTSTEKRSKAAEIISILKPSWEFNENGNSEGWDSGSFRYSVTDGQLTGTILGKIVPLPLSQSLEAEVGKNNKPKKRNNSYISDNSGPGLPITNVESYLINSAVNKELPPGLKGVNIHMAVSVPQDGNVIGDSGQGVSTGTVRVAQGDSRTRNNKTSRNNCTECKFGKFCPLFIEKIPGFCPRGTPTPPPGCYYQQIQCIKAPCNPILVCPTPAPTPSTTCTPLPPPCEGVRCPKFPTVIPPGGWCPPQLPRVLKFRAVYNAVNMLPQATPRSVNGNYVPPQKPLPKPLYFDVIADGQMHEYQVQFPNIDKFDLRNLKIVFTGAPRDSNISIDYIRFVGLSVITPSITPVAKNPINWSSQKVSLTADNFYLDVGEKRFFFKPDPNTGILIGPSLGVESENFTSLGVSWREHGIDMKVSFYFNNDNEKWWLSEMKTFNGLMPGEWISYGNINGVSGVLGDKFIAKNINLYSTSTIYKGAVYFENLILQPFINLDPRSTLAPTSAQIPITTKACTQEAKLCPNGTYVARSGPNCEFETCPTP